MFSGKNDQGLSDRLGLPGGYLFAPYHYANGASLVSTLNLIKIPMHLTVFLGVDSLEIE